MQSGKYTYFLSDFHLGTGTPAQSLQREKTICAFLDEIKKQCAAIYFVGDIFDFWFEYKTVVPRGFVRLLGKMAELKDAGIPVFVFTGNHDLWMDDYFEKEFQIPVYHHPIEVVMENKTFLIGHGDGLGPGDTGFKIMKKIFTNPFCKWLFRWVHPDIGVRVALFWSRRSRIATGNADDAFLGNDKEWLVQYCLQKLKEKPYDYFIFGHRHLPIDIPLGDSRYINLGDWLRYNSYAVYDGSRCELKYYGK